MITGRSRVADDGAGVFTRDDLRPGGRFGPPTNKAEDRVEISALQAFAAQQKAELKAPLRDNEVLALGPSDTVKYLRNMRDWYNYHRLPGHNADEILKHLRHQATLAQSQKGAYRWTAWIAKTDGVKINEEAEALRQKIDAIRASREYRREQLLHARK